jgi:hypothetical protein
VSEHVLDWFHITMRITVLSQYARGVALHDDAAGKSLLAKLERIKWLLWHGNQYRAGKTIKFFLDDVDALEVDYPNLSKFTRAAQEFSVYIASNAGRCSGRSAAHTCCCRPAHVRSTARSAASSNDRIRGLPMTTRTAPPRRLRREYPKKGHAPLQEPSPASQ